MTRINTNISSLQATHNLNSNQNALSTSMERLSSGLRINTAKDDPSGLIASENLRAEITSINSAVENSERANNVIATAEGALNEVSALLLEIRGLVTTSANDGALAEEEIEANQLQIDSILESIDRIANTTQFNGKKLLDGSLEYNLSSVHTSALEDVRVYAAKVDSNGTLPVTVEVKASAEFAQLIYSGGRLSANASVAIQVEGSEGSQVFGFGGSTTVSAIAAAINGFRDSLGVSATYSGTDYLFFNSTHYGSDAFVKVESLNTTTNFLTKSATTTANTSSTDEGVDADVYVNGQKAIVDGLTANVRNSSLDMELVLSKDFGTRLGTTTFGITGGGATFQLSPTVNVTGQVSLGINSVATGTLGNNNVGWLSSLKSGSTNTIVDGKTIQAQKIVDAAISQISTERGRLGAFQSNTIETNINSQQVALENVTASESAIRDADFAEETASLTRAQILVQATTSILKTANSQPQNVLSLLS